MNIECNNHHICDCMRERMRLLENKLIAMANKYRQLEQDKISMESVDNVRRNNKEEARKASIKE